MKNKIITFFKKRKFRILLLVIALPILIIVFYNEVEITHYYIKSDKIKEDSLSIVIITDLHSTSYGKNQEKLLEQIKEQNPDLILLGGDIYHDFGSNDGARMLVSKIPEIAPSFYVTGNHEWWSNKIETFTSEISAFGVRVLSDEYTELEINDNKIIIAGVDDPDKSKYEIYNQAESMREAFGGLKDVDGYKILLAHRPERIESYTDYPFDLVVSGHAHGGQVRVPFTNIGLFSPGQGIFPKYHGGIYQNDKWGDLVLIVSRGLSRTMEAMLRGFNRPELVVIKITA